METNTSQEHLMGLETFFAINQILGGWQEEKKMQKKTMVIPEQWWTPL